MKDYQKGEIIQLKEDASPVGTIKSGMFKGQKENGNFWGIPEEYFEIVDGDVFLKSSLASKLQWKVDGVMLDKLNIATQRPEEVEVNNEEGETEIVQVNPGFWCSNISKEDVR